MGRKYNVKHHRSPSHYPERLKARGETPSSVRMTSYEDLHRRAMRAEQKVAALRREES